MKVVTQHYIGTTQEWESANPKLYQAVWGFEKTADGKVLAKLGNGVDLWKSLKYFDMENIHGLPEKFQADLNQNLQAVTAEAQARAAADQGLQSVINNEAQARQSADQNLQSAINNEAQARQSADQNLRQTIAALQTKQDSYEHTIEYYMQYVQYLKQIIESTLGLLIGPSSLVTEDGNYLVTESGDYLVTA